MLETTFDILQEVRKYIEAVEVNKDGEERTLEKIIADGDMPPVYKKVVNEIDFIRRVK